MTDQGLFLSIGSFKPESVAIQQYRRSNAGLLAAQAVAKGLGGLRA